MNRIRELRERAGITQDQLASAIGGGWTKMKISRLETGATQLTVEMMKEIARALDVAPAELLDITALAELADDVEKAEVDDSLAAAIATRGLHIYRVKGRTVQRAGVKPGDLIAVDHTEQALAQLHTGDIVLVRACVVDSAEQHLVLRQYIEPGMLTTNRDGTNICMDAGETLTIVGVVIRGERLVTAQACTR